MSEKESQWVKTKAIELKSCPTTPKDPKQTTIRYNMPQLATLSYNELQWAKMGY